MNARILIAGGDSTTALTLTDLLHGLGHTVCAAAPVGREAVEQAADMRPDLALVDLDPPAGGIEAGSGLGQLEVPVVYLADDLDDAVLQRARETRPFGYVVKPPDDRQLRLTIDAALSRHASAGREPERDRAEGRLSALQQRNDLLQAVIQSLAEGVVVVDRKGRFVLSNGATREIFDVEPHALSDLDQAFSQYELCEPDEKTPFSWDRSPLRLTLEGSSTNDTRVFVRRSGESDGIHISSSGRPLHDPRGRLVGGVVVLRDVSRQTRTDHELQRTIASLQDQTALIESVFANMSEAVAVLDANNRCVMLNEEARQIAGVGPELDMADFERVRTGREFYHTVDGSPCLQEDLPSARVVRGETFDNQQIFRNDPGAGRIFLSASGRPLRNPDGTLRVGIVIYRNVTKDKHTEEELRELAEKLLDQRQAMETVFANISDGVVAVDERGRFTHYNRSAEAIMGKGPMGVAPQEWPSTYGHYRSDRTTPIPLEDLAIARAMRGEETNDAEMFVRSESKPDGALISVSGRPLLDADGKLKGGVITFRDITRLKEAETRLHQTAEELRKQNQFMETVFSSISDGVVVADANGQLTRANASAERMVGMGITDDGPDRWAETYGTFFPDKKTPFPSDRLPLVRAIQGESTDDVHLFIRNPYVPDGIHISVNGRPMRDTTGDLTGGVIVLRDVTRSVESREAELRAYAQGRLEVIDTVLHNIGNAINSVAAGVATLHEQSRNDALLERFTALADAVSAHEDDWLDWLRSDAQGRNVRPFLLALVADLRSRQESWRGTVARVSARVRHILDIIRTQEVFTDGTVEHKAVELREAITESVNVMADSLSKRGISVDVDCTGAPAEVLLQESKFHQMLVNLLKNAMEAIDALAGAERQEVAEPRIRVVAREQKKCLVIDVSDNGIGIAPDRLAKIFTAGYTSKDHGTGLGLHSAANYAVATGGSIEPLSEGVGRGTTMRVTLRMPEAPSARQD